MRARAKAIRESQHSVDRDDRPYQSDLVKWAREVDRGRIYRADKWWRWEENPQA